MDKKMIEKEIINLDPINLAYVGDAVYELLVRRDIAKINKKVNSLHKMAVNYVSAKSQADDLKTINDELTEDEKNIVRRARNSKKNANKNTDHTTYSLSTGFEALFGALYLSGDMERIEELYSKIKQNHKEE